MMLGIHDSHLGKFETASGLIVDILEPTKDMIQMYDIVAGLVNVCRFGGQLRRHYSVMAHSLLVMDLAPAELKKAALLHDASEAYLGDVIKPLKVLLGSVYGDIEAKWMAVIAEKYGLTAAELEAVKPYDKRALEIEDECLRRHGGGNWKEYEVRLPYMAMGRGSLIGKFEYHIYRMI